MKVAIDSGPLTSGHAVRGIGVNTRELIDGLKNLAKQEKNFEVFDFDFKIGKEKLAKGYYDIIHYPYFHPFFITLPFKRYGRKTVVTIHDLTQLIYPKYYPSGTKGSFRFFVQKMLLRNVDCIITISESSKKDIVRFLNVPQENVKVIYLAHKKTFKKVRDKGILEKVAKKYTLPRKFVLYVGDVNYNKNLPGLIKACEIAGIPLVVAGKRATNTELGLDLESIRGPKDFFRYLTNKPHPELAHFKLINDLLANNNKVLRVGFVPDEDMSALYSLATVYCQPSFYEGFGLPVLEAMACETPVVVARTQALVEIAGDAALIADPYNPEDMAAKIMTAFSSSSERIRLIRVGINRVKDFSWNNTVKQTYDLYKTLLNK